MFYFNILSFADPNTFSEPVANVFSRAAEGYTDSPAYISAYAAACLETILRLYYLRHGLGHYDTLLTHFLNLVGFNALKQLEHPSATSHDKNRQDALSTAVLCTQGYYDQGRNYYLAEVIYRLMRDQIKPEDRHLLHEGTNFDIERARERYMAEHTRAEYPIRVISFAEDAEDWRLDQLVSPTAGVTLDERVSVVSRA